MRTSEPSKIKYDNAPVWHDTSHELPWHDDTSIDSFQQHRYSLVVAIRYCAANGDVRHACARYWYDDHVWVDDKGAVRTFERVTHSYYERGVRTFDAVTHWCYLPSDEDLL